MSASSKSIFTFLAGAGTVIMASAYLKSANGQKMKRTLLEQLKMLRKETKESLNADWLNDFSDSAMHSAKTFREKMKL